MPDRFTLSMTLLPQPGEHLPLCGVTVLVVEDSRLASEALRLMCRRLGAQVRRAESLRAAGLYLRFFQPDVVIVDLGLPDGRGEELIRALSKSGLCNDGPRPLVLGLSGDGAGRHCAMAAGADGYLDKPVESFATLQDTLLTLLPNDIAMNPSLRDMALQPDPLALRDDLAYAARVMDGAPDPATQRYLAAFLGGVAKHARDPALAQSALRVRPDDLRAELSARLALPDQAFAKPCSADGLTPFRKSPSR